MPETKATARFALMFGHRPGRTPRKRRKRAEPMIPKATRRVRETTIRAGVAGIAGGFALATIFLTFTPYLAGVACGVCLAVVSAVALVIACAPEIRREAKTRRTRD